MYSRINPDPLWSMYKSLPTCIAPESRATRVQTCRQLASNMRVFDEDNQSSVNKIWNLTEQRCVLGQLGRWAGGDADQLLGLLLTHSGLQEGQSNFNYLFDV